MRRAISSKIKILHTLSSAELAGTERALLLLLDGSDRTRFEHFVAIPEHGPIEKHLADRGVKTFIIRRSKISPLYHAKLAALMASLHPHVLHIHYSRIDAIPARILGIATVERKNLTRESWHGATVSRNSFIDRIPNRFIQHVITPSRFTREYYLERRLADPNKISVIHNGLDLSPFDSEFDPAPIRRSLGIEEDDTVITAVGRLIELKGLRDAVSALATLLRSRTGLKLVLAGDGPDRDTLIDLASAAGITDSVIFAGKREDVPALLRASNIFVHPSYSEALSNSVLEAMAARIPVVASDIPGNSEIVEHEKTGLLYPPKSPDALAAAIARILDEPDLSGKLTASARALIESNFRLETMASRTEDIYTRLIDDN